MNPRVQQMYKAHRKAALAHFRRRHQERTEPLPLAWMDTYRVLARRAIRARGSGSVWTSRPDGVSYW